MTFGQLATLGTMQLYRRLYLATLSVALAAGLDRHALAADVCALAREAGAVLDLRRPVRR